MASMWIVHGGRCTGIHVAVQAIIILQRREQEKIGELVEYFFIYYFIWELILSKWTVSFDDVRFYRVDETHKNRQSENIHLLQSNWGIDVTTFL